jgi:ubiquinone/menaquinone biosynthesis C-methylase UbiE
MINPNIFTERLLKDAGISIGMKVIDIGCGNGEVSFLVSKLVGESGEVVGVDLDNQAITAARKRSEESECNNVTFVEGKISEVVPTLNLFDAAVGRRILMYLDDPVETLKNIARILRPGGLLAFQESDSTMVPCSLVSMPLHWVARGPGMGPGSHQDKILKTC